MSGLKHLLLAMAWQGESKRIALVPVAEPEPSPKTLQEENKEAMQEDPVSQEGTMERTSGKRRHNGDTHEGDTYETDTALRAGRACQWPRTRERLPMIQKLQSNRNWQWLDEGNPSWDLHRR